MYSIHSFQVRPCPGISFIKSSTICVSCVTASSWSTVSVSHWPWHNISCKVRRRLRLPPSRHPVQNVSLSSWYQKVCMESTSICTTTYHVYHSVKCTNSHNSAMPLPLMTAPMAPIYDIIRWNPPSLMTSLYKSIEEWTFQRPLWAKCWSNVTGAMPSCCFSHNVCT